MNETAFELPPRQLELEYVYVCPACAHAFKSLQLLKSVECCYCDKPLAHFALRKYDIGE
jgi:hypothetical protein